MRPRNRSVNPILPVRDVGATGEWYEQNLGAKDVWRYGDPPGHGGCHLGSSQIQFSLEKNIISGLEMFIFVANVPELYAEYLSRGVAISEEIEHKPWGATEFCVVDPNGVRLRFAEFRDRAESKPGLQGVDYALRHLSAAEHRSLYEAIEWTNYYTDKLNAETLSSSPLATIVASLEESAIGAASICGNGVEIFVVRDVMVMPEHQGKGIGRELMTRLMKWSEENVPQGAHIILQTGSGTTEFYEEFGFLGPDTGLVSMYLRR